MLNDGQVCRIRLSLLVCVSSLLLLLGCSKKQEATPAKQEALAQPQAVAQPAAAPQAATAVPPAAAASDDNPPPPPPSNSMVLPLNFDKHTGDLDEMVKRRNIRALVMLSPIAFFYDQGQPHGIMYETMEDFQRFANQKLKLGTPGLKVSFLPVAPAQAEAALTSGMGDIIVNGIVITPEREKRVAFSAPIETGVNQVIVSGPDFGTVSSVADLSGKVVYVNPLATYYENLKKVNAELQKAGKAPIDIKAADKNLSDEDLIQMVHAGLLAGDRDHDAASGAMVEGLRQSAAAVRRCRSPRMSIWRWSCGRIIRN